MGSGKWWWWEDLHGKELCLNLQEKAFSPSSPQYFLHSLGIKPDSALTRLSYPLCAWHLEDVCPHPHPLSLSSTLWGPHQCLGTQEIENHSIHPRPHFSCPEEAGSNSDCVLPPLSGLPVALVQHPSSEGGRCTAQQKSWETLGKPGRNLSAQSKGWVRMTEWGKG